MKKYTKFIPYEIFSLKYGKWIKINEIERNLFDNFIRGVHNFHKLNDDEILVVWNTLSDVGTKLECTYYKGILE